MPATRYRFTVDEFHRMAEAGIFHEDDRVELIDGEIVEMTPIGAAHAGCVNRLTRLFASTAGGTATVSVQNPVVLDRHQEFQPDVALLEHRDDGYRQQLPEALDVLLVIEVADTSVHHDRAVKLPRYAQLGIPESWLVNLPDDVIEVYREPRDGVYSARRLVRRGETLTPLNLPALELAASEILG